MPSFDQPFASYVHGERTQRTQANYIGGVPVPAIEELPTSLPAFEFTPCVTVLARTERSTDGALALVTTDAGILSTCFLGSLETLSGTLLSRLRSTYSMFSLVRFARIGNTDGKRAKRLESS